MASIQQPIIVATDWLSQRLGSPDIRVVDASWHMPAAERSGRAEFDEAHIPGAVFFDIDEIADSASALPHMLPPAEKFASRVKKLGIGDGSTIVVYDSFGMMAAARVWWMFRAMGHGPVFVLDGGFSKWRADGLPVSDEIALPFERHFTARPDWSVVKTAADVQKMLGAGGQVVDARSAGRFTGAEPEPRAGLRGGHMPGALNLPHTQLLRPDGTLKKAEDLTRLFTETGVDLRKPVTTTCGSGVSASLVLLALAVAGHKDGALYDGSWSEWGARDELPVATG